MLQKAKKNRNNIAMHDQFYRQNSLLLHAVCTALIAVVAMLDYLTGFEVSFFMFYALPIWVATWYQGLKVGIIYALIALIGWSLSAYYTDHHFSHPLIPYWNGGMRLGFFLFSAFTLNALNEKIRVESYNADYDILTGLLNARGFFERADIVHELLKRKNEAFALAYIDIDNFKKVNDTMGHHEGDHILQATGKIMKSAFRASDLTCRMGGDEFVVMLPRLNDGDLSRILHTLKDKLDSVSAEHDWPIGYSIGAQLFDSGQSDIKQAVQAADSLMYEVKKSGKGRVTIAEQAPKAAE